MSVAGCMDVVLQRFQTHLKRNLDRISKESIFPKSPPCELVYHANSLKYKSMEDLLEEIIYMTWSQDHIQNISPTTYNPRSQARPVWAPPLPRAWPLSPCWARPRPSARLRERRCAVSWPWPTRRDVDVGGEPRLFLQ